MNQECMLVENAQIRDSLRKIVARLATDPALQEDLMQEGLVRLWKAECEYPGRTRSWYLQNCRFCVQHCLALGRSIDSPKRSTPVNRVPINGSDDESDLDEVQTEGELFEGVSFRDLHSVLSGHLTWRERMVLDGLAGGLHLSEIASEFKLSYPTALKYRRRIAELVSRLGIPRPLGGAKAGAASRKSGKRLEAGAEAKASKPRAKGLGCGEQ